MTIKFTHLDTRQVETTESFFSNQYINGRIKSGHDSNRDYDPILEEGRSEEWMQLNWKKVRDNLLNYEEDVNQYITLTLADLVTPKSLGLVNEYLVDINADAGQAALKLEETFKQYLMYRINADFLLLNLGLFHPDSNVLGTAYFDKGEFYYFSAASTLKKTRGGSSGLSDVLEKLSNGFGNYVKILRCMKNEADNYFSFHFRISLTEMGGLESTLTEEVRKKRNPGTS